MANEQLRRRREATVSPSGSGLPMTRAELAEAVNRHVWSATGRACQLDADTLARYERGQIRWPGAMYREGLRAVLGVGADADLGFFPTRRGRTAGPRLAEPAVTGPATDASVRVVGDPVRLPGLAGLGERVVRAIHDPARYADQDVVHAFRLQLEVGKALDGRHGAATALPVTLGVVGGLWALAQDAPARLRPETLTLAAEAAEFAGWLHRDLADAAQAVHWYDRAMEYAQAAGDAPMQGFVLLRKSQMAYEKRDGHRVLLFARAALEGPWTLAPRLRSEALLQVALGQAMTGASARVPDLIARAQGHSDESEGLLELRAAPCWIEAGQAERSAEILDIALASDALSFRDRGFFQARRAAALQQLDMTDDAVRCATEAMTTAKTTGSRRTLQVVRGAFAREGLGAHHPGVHAVRQTLSLLA